MSMTIVNKTKELEKKYDDILIVLDALKEEIKRLNKKIDELSPVKRPRGRPRKDENKENNNGEVQETI